MNGTQYSCLGYFTSNHPRKSAKLHGSDTDFDESAYRWSQIKTGYVHVSNN